MIPITEHSHPSSNAYNNLNDIERHARYYYRYFVPRFVQLICILKTTSLAKCMAK